MNANAILMKGPVYRRSVLLVAIAGVPVLVVRGMNDPVNVPKLSLLMTCVAIAGGIRVLEITQGATMDALRRLLFPAAAIVVPLSLAWVFSPYRGWSLFGHYPRFTGLLPYVVVALGGILIADAFAGRAINVAWAVTSAGAVSGAYAVIQKIGLDPYVWSVGGRDIPDVVSSTLGNPDFVGGFLAIVLPIAVALYFVDVERRRWVATAAALIVAGWLVSFSQGGWGAGAAGVVILGSFIAARRFRFARVTGVLVASAIAIAGIGAVVMSIVSQNESGATATRRADWWVAAFDMTKSSPVVGRGPSSFALEHSRYRTLTDARDANLAIENDPHNVFLSFSTGAGILGLIGYGLFLAWGIREGMQLENDNLVGAAFFGAFVAYGIQALVSIDTVALRTAGWSVLGALVASRFPAEKSITSRRSGRKERRAPQPLRRLLAVIVTLLGAGAFAMWSLNFGIKDARALDVRETLAKGDVNAAQEMFRSTIGFREEIQYRRDYAEHLGSLAIGLAKAGNDRPAQLLFDRVETVYGPIEDMPYVPAIVGRARFLQNWAGLDPAAEPVDAEADDHDPEAAARALELYERAMELDPLDPILASEVAGLALALDRPEVALEVLDPLAERVEQSWIWGQLAVAAARTGNEQQARAAIDRALALNPEEASAESALDLLDSRK